MNVSSCSGDARPAYQEGNLLQKIPHVRESIKVLPVSLLNVVVGAPLHFSPHASMQLVRMLVIDEEFDAVRRSFLATAITWTSEFYLCHYF